MTAAISKYPCPPGFKSTGLTGASRTTFANSCTECVAGNYCDGADHAETTCPAGYFCPAGTKFATQFPCPAATSSTTGQTSVAGCNACTGGTFCPPGTGTPRPCPPGAACNDLQLDRYSDLCPAGQYFSASACTKCPNDHYCPPGVHYPLKCPAGTKGLNPAGAIGNRDRYEECVPCAAGELCPRYGTNGQQADYTLVAGSGYYAPVGTEFK